MSDNLHELLHPASERQDIWRGASLAFLLSVLVHVGLVWAVPASVFKTEILEKVPRWEKTEVEYLPEPEPLEKPEFVEANPDAPQNEPDETLQEAARAQQAAQEKPDKLSDSEKPAVEGEDEVSPKIVKGSMEEEEVSEPLKPGLYGSGSAQTPTPENSEAVKPVATAAPPPSPPDFIMQDAVSEEGPGSTLKELGKSEQKTEKPVQRVIELTRDGKVVEVTQEAAEEAVLQEAAAQGVPAPMPRPKLRFTVPSGPIMRQPIQASQMGIVAIDAKYSEFGEYMQRMVEAVSQQWQLLGSRSNLADGNLGTKVALRFSLDKEGNVQNMEVLHTSATRPATLICQDAVQSRSPYGVWTEAMKARMGDDMPITFTFHYR